MPKTERTYFDAAELRAFVRRALVALDVRDDDAALVAEILGASDMRGIESHGVARLERFYVDRIRDGFIDPRARETTMRETATSLAVDANNALGHPVSDRVMRRTIAKAAGTIAVCTIETLLCMARAEHVYGLFTRFPQIAVNVAKYLYEQRDNALAIVEDLAYLTVPQRLLRQLNRLAIEYGKPVADGVLLDIRLTHADLAALIGTTRETISAQLARSPAKVSFAPRVDRSWS